MLRTLTIIALAMWFTEYLFRTPVYFSLALPEQLHAAREKFVEGNETLFSANSINGISRA